MRVKMPKQPPPAPTASAVGPCPTVIQIVGRPGTGSLSRTIAPPSQPLVVRRQIYVSAKYNDCHAYDWLRNNFESVNYKM